ncbi:MAG: hypothetical protein HKN29_08430, partial [Rhodothermales bacterium]|nr:hypothetical protein [Rhodothermales bacterium]
VPALRVMARWLGCQAGIREVNAAPGPAAATRPLGQLAAGGEATNTAGPPDQPPASAPGPPAASGPVYRQAFEGFVPDLSAIDLLFNHGPRARNILLAHPEHVTDPSP